MNDFECNEVLPMKRPLLKKTRIITFHQLKAAVEVVLNPTSYVR